MSREDPEGPEVDPWGFYVAEMPWAALPGSRDVIAEAKKQDTERDSKWHKMTKAGDLRIYTLKRGQRARLLRRIRKGVPLHWRAAVWPQLIGIDVKPKYTPGRTIDREREAHLGVSYAELCARADTDSESFEIIERDLCRTYPRHVLFDSKVEDGGGAIRDHERKGVTQLRRILRAYATLDPECGYCQGMNYVIALLLIHQNSRAATVDPQKRRRSLGGPLKKKTDEEAEEEVFWFFTTLAYSPRTHLRELWLPDMLGCRKSLFVFDDLLKKLVGPCHAHMVREGIHPSMYATHWIVTLFAAQFPFVLVTRVWDTFLAEGWKSVYRVAIAVIAAYDKEILSKDFESIMIWLRELPEKIDVSRVLGKAEKLNLTTDDLKRAENKWDPQNPDGDH